MPYFTRKIKKKRTVKEPFRNIGHVSPCFFLIQKKKKKNCSLKLLLRISRLV